MISYYVHSLRIAIKSTLSFEMSSVVANAVPIIRVNSNLS